MSWFWLLCYVINDMPPLVTGYVEHQGWIISLIICILIDILKNQ